MTSRAISAFAAEEERRVLSLKPVLAPAHGRYGDHPHQSYDAWPSDDPDAPLVILLHGGYWRYDRMHLTPFAAYLSQQGFDVLLPGFRRSGGAGGCPETFDDVARVVDTLPEGRPYVLAGHCSGGHLALWCAARGLLPPGSRWHTRTLPTSVLALAPLTDLTATRRDRLSDDAALQLLGGEQHFEKWLPEVDPLTLLRDAGTTGVPTVLLHGAADEEVPLSQFSDYAAVHRDLRTVVLPGTGHYTLIEPGAPGARAVAGTLREMAAAFTPGRPGRAGEEAARR
ncbi:putative lipase/esterase [Streptomyces ambofaciens ATCC 23877]|uniref:Putative lipase/esterase n=1 Tax=Streptomyces ambofaciens (strain ATCC 23877 / 3486 / DSM 40053 / JCM 4204 / NBRC 12836 / NRRL B-2516) TaxID=278992 RepID=A3KI22_STRA7|nr:alpha/beta fold hydrolase [Streptomyces ambofaciens]AKZ53463.1 putative lipase/esterase [Streptomyces ambofaciens ATCC 23877]CAJ89349.1 putative lipase/esterase [Streptomyces ambofaciens ATCC 23877]